MWSRQPRPGEERKRWSWKRHSPATRLEGAAATATNGSVLFFYLFCFIDVLALQMRSIPSRLQVQIRQDRAMWNCRADGACLRPRPCAHRCAAPFVKHRTVPVLPFLFISVLLVKIIVKLPS
jgi:hypothetical protein